MSLAEGLVNIYISSKDKNFHKTGREKQTPRLAIVKIIAW